MMVLPVSVTSSPNGSASGCAGAACAGLSRGGWAGAGGADGTAGGAGAGWFWGKTCAAEVPAVCPGARAGVTRSSAATTQVRAWAWSLSSTDFDPPRLRAGFARHLWIDSLARLRVLDAPEMHGGPLLFHYTDSQIAAISPYKSDLGRTRWSFVYQDERSRQRDRGG